MPEGAHFSDKSDAGVTRVQSATGRNNVDQPSQAPVPSPSREGYIYLGNDEPASKRRRGGPAPILRVPLSLLIRLLALACRALAIALAFIVTVGVVAIGVLRPSLIEATRTMSSLLPSALQGTFVFETPLGGALRGDFVIASIVLFVSDWLLVRCAYRLRPA